MMPNDQDNLLEQLGHARDKYNNLLLKIIQFREHIAQYERWRYDSYYITADATDHMKRDLLEDFDLMFPREM